ncbi:MAG: efflux RND transporter periplasmic adaptor subunit [Rhizobiaceae bacterium]|nr:efflux RND transporter periplasmic adaptor subunit [Rhizobiaceae bacterium]
MDQLVKPPKPVVAPDVGAALGIDATGRSKPRRRLWPFVALLVAAGLGAGAWWWFGQPAEAVRFATTAAERGTLTVEVSSTGTLQPLTQVDVSSELSGVVREVTVDVNSRVAAGDMLARLDTTRIAAQIERAQANVTAAQARVGEARVTLNEAEQGFARAEQLSARGMVAEQALDTARAVRDRAASAVETAQANLAIAEADLKLQQADLAKSTIYAPIDGIVLTRSVNPGQTVAASTQAPVLFVIAENLETMQLNAAIDEADIGTVKAGQKARFTVDAFPERRFDATIRDISFASTTTEGVVTYQARLDVSNAELLLRPGMTATVNVVTREANDVLLVPSAAFRFTPPAAQPQRSFSLTSLFSGPRMGPGFGGRQQARNATGGRSVWVLENGQPVRKQVSVGAIAGDMTEIVSGLEDGAQVITGIARSGAATRASAANRTSGQNAGGPPAGGPPPPGL